MIRVLYVPKNKLTEIAFKLLPFITKSLKTAHGEYTVDDILNEILDNKRQLWGVVDDDEGIIGAFTTRISIYPQYKVLQVTHLGGSRMMEWYEEMDRELIKFAKAHQCRSIRHMGRGGWARAAKRAGYEQRYVVMDKAVE